MRRKNYDKILTDLYTRLYKAATPSADFSELLKNAKEETIDGKIVKRIDYDSYYLNLDDYRKIVEDVQKEHKLNAYEKSWLIFEAYLGAGPTSLKKRNS